MAEYLTLPQVAKELGIGRARVWQLVSERKLKAVRYGHAWLVSRPEVERRRKAMQKWAA